MPVATLLAETEGSSGREESTQDEAVCSFGMCSRPGLCTKRDPKYSPSCTLSTVWGEVPLVPGKSLGESVQKRLNIEALLNNGRVGEALTLTQSLAQSYGCWR